MQRVCQSMQKLNKHMDEYWKYLHMNAIKKKKKKNFQLQFFLKSDIWAAPH